MSGRENRPHPAKIFRFEYTSTFADNYSYNFSHLFFRFMHQQRRTELLELLDLVRSGNHPDYKRLIETWGEDAQLAADYDSFLDEQVDNVNICPTPPPPTSSLSPSPATVLQRSKVSCNGLTVAWG